jgi:hypothetical protein
MLVLDIILKFAKHSGECVKNFGQVVDKRVCIQPPLVICVSTTFLQDHWEQFILNYILMELQ